MSMLLPALEPTVLPELSFLTMYGPEEMTCVLYVDGLFASNFFAKSAGTGAVTGITRAAANETPTGDLSLNTIVWSSGVVMPEIGLTPLVGFSGAPAIGWK